MKKAIIILSIVAVIGLSGYLFYKKQIDKLIDMDYKVVGVKFQQAALTKTVADLKLQIYSDSTLEAEIKELNLDAYINGKKIGVITKPKDKTIIIPAKGFSIVEVTVETSPLEVGSNAIDLIGQIWKEKDANLTLKGNAKIKSAFVTFPVPIDYTESIKYLLS